MLAAIVGLMALGGLVLVNGLGVRASPVPEVRPEVPVTAMNISLGLANNSPTLVADPAEPRFVALASRLDAPDFGCALHVSGDGGRGWVPAEPVSSLPPGAEKCYAPEVAFDRQGRLHYLFVGLAGAGNQPMGVFLTTSSDRARTFSPPRQVLGPLNFGVRMAIDPNVGGWGRIHLVWLHASSDPPLGGFAPGPNPIQAAHSDDGGTTFSTPVQVSDPERERVVAPALALGPDRGVHIAYYDLQGDAVDYQGLEGPTWPGSWSVVLASSTDGGRGFARGTVVEDSIVPFERVMLIFTMAPPALVAQADGEVCAGWADARHGDADVLVRCSRDDRRSWGPTTRVNDDPLGNGLRQYLPRLAASPDGRLDVVFYDRRADTSNVLNDVTYTYSSDGGRRFVPNVTVTRDPSDSRIGQQYVGPAAEGQHEIGSRLGLLSLEEGTLAAWTDTRNSVPFTPGQDIFATAIDLGSTSDEGRPWLLASAVGVVVFAGLAAYVLRYRRRRTLVAE